MGTPFLGEIRMFAGNFAPSGWALCQGQLLDITTNTALFSLLGTTYGGDGQNTFGLPDLRGRVPVNQGNGSIIGQNGGSETVGLTTAQIPGHSHLAQGQGGDAASPGPGGNVWGNNSGVSAYSTIASPPSSMNPAAIAMTGGSLPHDNMMPFLAINFIIALQGIFPSRN